jgi:membrane-bound serine protease (ClpP class)
MRTTLLTLAFAAAAFADNPVVVVAIDDEVDPSTVYLVKRSLDGARASSASLVLFEINTPGGRLDSAMDIANLIDQAGVPTAAYVRAGTFGGAQSAGALLAIACGRIVMDDTATIGSAQPITTGGVLAPEKVLSWVSGTFRAWAEKKGMPPAIAAGMVDPDLEISELIVAGKRVYATRSESEKIQREGGKLVRVVKPSGKLLNMTAGEALDAGLASKIVGSREQALAAFDSRPNEIVEMRRAWSETFVGFATQGFVTGVLIMIGFMALWIEIKTPGLGVPALISAACFGTVFFAHWLVGLTGATEIALFLVGAGLLVAEFLTLGFGLAGVAGIVLILSSLVLALQGFFVPSNAWQWNSFAMNFMTLTASTGAAVVGFAALVHFLPNTPMFKHLILDAQVAAAEAPAAAVLAGRAGTAATDLRPSGKAEVDGMTVDVLAEGDFIPRGSPVTVVKVEGPSVIVRRA